MDHLVQQHQFHKWENQGLEPWCDLSKVAQQTENKQKPRLSNTRLVYQREQFSTNILSICLLGSPDGLTSGPPHWPSFSMKRSLLRRKMVLTHFKGSRVMLTKAKLLQAIFTTQQPRPVACAVFSFLFWFCLSGLTSHHSPATLEHLHG